MRRFEIIDENGNIHGPFGSTEEAERYATSRGLGEQQKPDDESGRGWYYSLAFAFLSRGPSDA